MQADEHPAVVQGPGPADAAIALDSANAMTIDQHFHFQIRVHRRFKDQAKAAFGEVAAGVGQVGAESQRALAALGFHGLSRRYAAGVAAIRARRDGLSHGAPLLDHKSHSPPRQTSQANAPSPHPGLAVQSGSSSHSASRWLSGVSHQARTFASDDGKEMIKQMTFAL